LVDPEEAAGGRLDLGAADRRLFKDGAEQTGCLWRWEIAWIGWGVCLHSLKTEFAFVSARIGARSYQDKAEFAIPTEGAASAGLDPIFRVAEAPLASER
jgi:hypothetical protein